LIHLIEVLKLLKHVLFARYETGLEQLDFAAGQVAVMQQNLRDLQPLLVETSDKTEKLMIKIEQDTVVVEKQKEARLKITLLVF
jgi:hypothetical protein